MMTDDLVKRLRGMRREVATYLTPTGGTVVFEPDATASEAADRIEALEARLAKAVAALREATHQHRVIAGFDLMCASVTAYNAARAAEAALRELGAEPSPPEFRADDAIFLAKYAQHVAEELGIAQSTEEPTK